MAITEQATIVPAGIEAALKSKAALLKCFHEN